MASMTTKMLSEAEEWMLLMALGRGKGEKEIPPEHAAKVMEWARRIKFEYSVLQMVYMRVVDLTIKDDEVAYRFKPAELR